MQQEKQVEDKTLEEYEVEFKLRYEQKKKTEQAFLEQKQRKCSSDDNDASRKKIEPKKLNAERKSQRYHVYLNA